MLPTWIAESWLGPAWAPKKKGWIYDPSLMLHQHPDGSWITAKEIMLMPINERERLRQLGWPT